MREQLNNKVAVIGGKAFYFVNDDAFLSGVEVIRRINDSYPGLTKCVEIFDKKDKLHITTDMKAIIFSIDGMSTRDVQKMIEKMKGDRQREEEDIKTHKTRTRTTQ